MAQATKKTKNKRKTPVAVKAAPTSTRKNVPRTQPRRAYSWVATKVASFFKNYGVFSAVLISVVVPQLLLLWRPIVGVYADMAGLALLLVVGVFVEKARKLAISTSILLVATIVTLCLPKTSAFVRLAVYYDFILLLALIYRYIFALDAPTKRASELGKKYIILLPLMIVIGEALGALGYLALRRHYPYQGIPLSYVLMVVIVFAMAEEMLFRGLIQHLASEVMHPRLAAVLTVIAYTFASISHATIWTAAFALGAGIVLSTIYYFKHNLMLTTTANALMKLTYVGLIATFVLH